MARFLQKNTVSDLVRSAQEGQNEAFDVLYEHFYQAIFHYVFARMQNYHDAEDITQEVFLRAWMNLNKYEDQGIPFTHYLFRIAHNAVVDFHRRNKRVVYVEDIDFNQTDEVMEDEMDMYLDMNNLSVFLNKLPPDYQKVLVLRFLTGLTPEETARAMKRSAVATRILQHRALVAIRELANQKENV